MQVVDLHEDPGFESLDVELLSVAPDSPTDWKAAAADYAVPPDAILLSDDRNQVASAYDVMQWQAATGEPGHTFVLVDEAGKIAWIKDYGAPENGGVMYVFPDELVERLSEHLAE